MIQRWIPTWIKEGGGGDLVQNFIRVIVRSRTSGSRVTLQLRNEPRDSTTILVET
jgi:hypothetical protein